MLAAWRGAAGCSVGTVAWLQCGVAQRGVSATCVETHYHITRLHSTEHVGASSRAVVHDSGRELEGGWLEGWRTIVVYALAEGRGSSGRCDSGAWCAW